MPEQPRIGVVGCGAWGKNIVRTMHGLGVLRAVADPAESGRALARELAPTAVVADDAQALLDDPELDGLMIATPAETHYELACRAIEAGKDIFVEKPLTIDLTHARDLVDRACRAGRVLMVGHLLEYHPAVLTLLKLVSSGELGHIRYLISNRLNLGKIRTEENALWSFAPHDIAVILRLVNALPTEVVATEGSYVSPDIADVTVTQLRFSDETRSHVFVSWLHPFKEQRLVVIGSRKMASFDDVSKQLVLYDQRVDWHEGQPVPVRGEGTPVAFGGAEPLREECRHFIECIQTRATPRTDGVNGLRVLRILHAAQRSLASHGDPVELNWTAADASDAGEAVGASVVIETLPDAAQAQVSGHVEGEPRERTHESLRR